jgi:hypothetical protein
MKDANGMMMCVNLHREDLHARNYSMRNQSLSRDEARRLTKGHLAVTRADEAPAVLCRQKPLQHRWNFHFGKSLLVICLRGDLTMDDLKKTGTHDRSKINCTKHLNVAKKELQRAVDTVGSSAAAAQKQLAA